MIVLRFTESSHQIASAEYLATCVLFNDISIKSVYGLCFEIRFDIDIVSNSDDKICIDTYNVLPVYLSSIVLQLFPSVPSIAFWI